MPSLQLRSSLSPFCSFGSLSRHGYGADHAWHSADSARILAGCILHPGEHLFYVAFWLNLSILFSVRFRQPATSALSGIAVWLFFSVFYGMILNLIARAIAPSGQTTVDEYIRFQELMLGLQRLSPSTLFGEATTTLLMPSVPTLGFLTQEQAYRYIPSPLPISQSLILVWPQLTGMVAATLICFAVSYVLFMRQEIRSR